MAHWSGPVVRPARIRVTTVAAVLFFVAPLVAEAQSTKVWRVGYLTPVIANGNPRLVAFQQRLRELGYVEPQNIVLDIRSAEATASIPIIMTTATDPRRRGLCDERVATAGQYHGTDHPELGPGR